MTRFHPVLFASSMLLAACGGSAPEPAAPEGSQSDTPASEPASAESPPPEAAPADQVFEEESKSDDGEWGGAARDEDEGARSGAEAQASLSSVRELEVLLGDDYDSFAEALSAGQPDCTGAARFADRVCALAERICELSAELPSSGPAHGTCEDGRRRCETVRKRFTAVCG